MTKDNYQSDFLCSFAVPDRNLLKKVCNWNIFNEEIRLCSPDEECV